MADAMAPYRLELAKSDRSMCTVSKVKIEKGEVRLGSLLKMGGKGSYKWRKLGCVTAKQVANIEELLGGAEKVDGFEELPADQQAAVLEAFKRAASAPAGAAKAISSEALDSPPAKKAKVAAPVPASSSASSSAAASKPGASSEEVLKVAHSAIDLAKAARWKELLALLDAHPGLVDVRPAVRDYSVMHQAAFHGSRDVVAVLLDLYGADPAQLTKHGKSAVVVANEQGHSEVAELLSLHIAKQKAGSASAPSALTPEKVSKERPSRPSDVKPGQHSVTPAPGTLLPGDVQAAHGLIDLAKAGCWPEVFKVLETRRELVNVRPEVREFGALHQAAFLGDAKAAEALLDRFGADPAQASRTGAQPAEIARGQGHHEVAALIEARCLGAAAAPAGAVEDEGDDDLEMVQQADGTWKVAVKAPPAAAAVAAAPSAPPAVQPPAPLPVPPPAVPSAGTSSSSSAPSASSAAPIAAAAAPPGSRSDSSSAAPDTYFREAGAWHVVDGPNGLWECKLKQGARSVCLLQLLQEADGRCCVWCRWGPSGAEGKHEAAHVAGVEAAVEKFKSKFFEKTNNPWDSRASFKPFFGKWTLAEAPVKAEPAAAADPTAEAHRLIDAAKAGRWGDVYKALDRRRELVNLRPEVREYAVLHQAAFYGNAPAASKLLDTYGADPRQATKSGLSAADVAAERGHAALAASLRERTAAAVAAVGSTAAAASR